MMSLSLLVVLSLLLTLVDRPVGLNATVKYCFWRQAMGVQVAPGTVNCRARHEWTLK